MLFYILVLALMAEPGYTMGPALYARLRGSLVSNGKELKSEDMAAHFRSECTHKPFPCGCIFIVWECGLKMLCSAKLAGRRAVHPLPNNSRNCRPQIVTVDITTPEGGAGHCTENPKRAQGR